MAGVLQRGQDMTVIRQIILLFIVGQIFLIVLFNLSESLSDNLLEFYFFRTVIFFLVYIISFQIDTKRYLYPILILPVILLPYLALRLPSIRYESLVILPLCAAILLIVDEMRFKKMIFFFLVGVTFLSQIFESAFQYKTFQNLNEQNYFEITIFVFFILGYAVCYHIYFNYFHTANGSPTTDMFNIDGNSRFQSFVERMPLNVLQTDLQGNRIFGTKRTAALFGEDKELNEDELKEFANFGKRIIPEDLAKLQRTFQTAIRSKRSEHLKIRGLKTNGEIIHLAGGVTAQFDENNNPTGFILAYYDETDSVLASNKLQHSENLYKELVESIPSSILRFTEDGTILYASNYSHRALGLRSGELLGQKIQNYIHQDSLEVFHSDFEKLKKGNIELDFLYRYNHSSRSRAYFEGKVTVVLNDQSQNEFLITYYDVSLREIEIYKRRKLENEYQGIYNLAPIGITTGKDGFLNNCNEYFLEITGYTMDEIKANSSSVLIHPEDLESFQLKLELVKNDHSIEEGHQFRLVKKDGTDLHVFSRIRARVKPDGSYLDTMVIITDITQLEETRKLLNDKQLTLNSVLNSINDGIYAFDKEYNIIAINDKAKKEFKDYATEPIHIDLGVNLREAIKPELFNTWEKQYFERIFTGEQFVNRIYRTFNEKELVFDNVYIPVHDANGSIFGGLEISRDLTEVILKDKQIDESNRRRHDVYQNEFLGISYFDHVKMEFSEMNKAMLRFFGIDSFEEIKGEIFRNHFPQYQLDKTKSEDFFKQIIDQTLEEGVATFTFTIKSKQGNKKIGLGNTSVDYTNNNSIIFFCQDITENYKTNLSLQRSEQRFTKLFENNQLGIITLLDKKIIVANPAFSKVVGISSDEAKGSSISDFLHEEDLEKLDNIIQSILAEDVKSIHAELRIVNKTTGITGYILATISQEENNIDSKSIILTMVDITQRKYAQLDLEKSENRYKNLLNVMPNGIAILTFSCQTIFFSEKGKSMLSNYIGTPETFSIQNYLVPEQFGKLEQIIKEVLNSGEERKGILKFKADNEKHFYLEGHFSIMEEEVFAQSILWIFSDVTKSL